MKLRASLACILLSALPAGLFAAATPGAVAKVTVNLSADYETGGYAGGEDTKVITDTATSYVETYKDVIKTQKISNKEYIALLFTKFGVVNGVVADWSIDFVEDYGFFLAKKDGSAAYYLGRYGNDASASIRFTGWGTYIESYEGRYTETLSSGSTLTYGEKYSGKGSQVAYFSLYIDSNTTLTGNGVWKYSYSGDYVYDDVNNEYLKDEYKETAGSVSQILAEDDDEFIVTGSVSVGAFKSVADISVYVTAYNNFFL